MEVPCGSRWNLTEAYFYQSEKNTLAPVCTHPRLVGVFWSLELYKEESICLICVGVCSLGHLQSMPRKVGVPV